MRDGGNERLWGGRTLVVLRLCMLVALAICAAPALAWADDKSEAEQLVEKARLTLEAFVNDPQMRDPLRSRLR